MVLIVLVLGVLPSIGVHLRRRWTNFLPGTTVRNSEYTVIYGSNLTKTLVLLNRHQTIGLNFRSGCAARAGERQICELVFASYGRHPKKIFWMV